MSRIALTRTIRSLPGKREQYLEFLHKSDEARRRRGLVHSLVLQKAIDPDELLVIQVWEDEERYKAWRQSPERTAIMAESRHLRVREPTLMYRVLQGEEGGGDRYGEGA